MLKVRQMVMRVPSRRVCKSCLGWLMAGFTNALCDLTLDGRVSASGSSFECWALNPAH